MLEWEINGVLQTPINAGSYSAEHVFQIPLGAEFTQLNYNISATGTGGLVRNAFCQSRVLAADNATTLVINEAMSSNTATIADENGEFDDSIELHNHGIASVSLSGMYLSDKADAPKYWI